MPIELTIGSSIPQTTLQILDIIGHGATSTVYLAKETDGSEFAVKWIPKDALIEEDITQCRKEIDYMTLLKGHKNITELIRSIETEESFILILEFCHADLFDAIFVECGLPSQLIRRFFLDLLTAVEYCHEKGIYHQDIKPENVLINDKGVAKLSDFGLATCKQFTNELEIGSRRYMAPECFQGKSVHTEPKMTVPIDVWALGIVLLNMFNSQSPWKEATFEDDCYTEFMQSNPSFLEQRFNLNPRLGQFLKSKVLTADPSKRCNVTEFKRFISRFTDIKSTQSSYRSCSSSFEILEEKSLATERYSVAFSNSVDQINNSPQFCLVENPHAKSQSDQNLSKPWVMTFDKKEFKIIGSPFPGTSLIGSPFPGISSDLVTPEQSNSNERLSVASSLVHKGSFDSSGRFYITSMSPQPKFIYMETAESRINLSKIQL